MAIARAFSGGCGCRAADRSRCGAFCRLTGLGLGTRLGGRLGLGRGFGLQLGQLIRLRACPGFGRCPGLFGQTGLFGASGRFLTLGFFLRLGFGSGGLARPLGLGQPGLFDGMGLGCGTGLLGPLGFFPALGFFSCLCLGLRTSLGGPAGFFSGPRLGLLPCLLGCLGSRLRFRLGTGGSFGRSSLCLGFCLRGGFGCCYVGGVRLGLGRSGGRFLLLFLATEKTEHVVLPGGDHTILREEGHEDHDGGLPALPGACGSPVRAGEGDAASRVHPGAASCACPAFLLAPGCWRTAQDVDAARGLPDNGSGHGPPGRRRRLGKSQASPPGFCFFSALLLCTPVYGCAGISRSVFIVIQHIMPSHVRIIGGHWKRSLLPVPDGDGLRPTPDRVRETLFNWLGQSLTGWRCLDLFAGSGALGLEAASRGAARVILVEQSPPVARSLQDSVRRLKAGEQVQVVRADAASWLDRNPPLSQDLILLDPPFKGDWLPRILPRVLPWLAPGGLIYAEAGFALDDAWLQQHGLPGLAVIRRGRAGQVHYHLLSAQPAP